MRAAGVGTRATGERPSAGPHTLGRWIEERARRHPERVAIEFAGSFRTYRQVDDASWAIARSLAERGLRRGDRLATVTGNCPEHLELLFACAKSGIALAPLNWRLSSLELAAQLEILEPRLVAVSEENTETATSAAARAGLAPPVGIGDLGERHDEGAGDLGSGPPAEPPEDGDALLIVFTSGSTGRPKGAVLSHFNCFFTNLGLDGVVPLGGGDVVLQVLPQYHVGGWNVQPLQAIFKGATLVLEPDFDPGRALSLIERRKVTTTMGVPTTYLLLAEEPRFPRTDLSSLRCAIVGGAAMPPSLLARWDERGVAIAQGYGLTEASPNVLCLEPKDALRRPGSVGRPYPLVEVELRHPATGERLAGAGTGVVHVRGPNVFSGYLRDEKATAEVLRDGWLSTGDIAERDADGYHYLRGRTVEMFISGGENVYPVEIENALASHPAVLEAAVVGMPHPRWGEAGLAFVVLRHDREASSEELSCHCRQLLAAFKIPSEIRFVSELAKTSSGKIDRRRLRAGPLAGIAGKS